MSNPNVATVETVIDLVNDDQGISADRDELHRICLKLFPEFKSMIDEYFEDLEKSVKEAEVVKARLDREFLQAQWAWNRGE